MVEINKGDLVRIEYTGYVTTDGSVFESTDEEVAKKSGIYSDKTMYGPRLVLYGRGAMLPGLEQSLTQLKVGKLMKVKIPSNGAFGEKHNDLVRVISKKEFEKHNVNATPGLVVTLDGVPAKIKSVSSGRILLDFNHPLAGHEVEYSIRLIEVITDNTQKINELSKQFNVKMTVEEKNGKKKILIDKSIESAKIVGLKATLHSTVGDWAEVEVEK